MGPCGPGGLNVEEDAAEEATATLRPVAGVTDVVAVAAGKFHSLALRRDGTVWAWGADELRDLVGDDDLVPVQVPALHDVAMVATGDNHAIALTGAGTVKTWGWNNVGQLGNGENGAHYYLPQDE